jgi:mannan endo-1,4-beta-mannosidase
VKEGRLVVGESCKEFYFAGWNMWEVVELGSNAPSPPFRSTPKKGQEHLLNVLNEGVAAGMKVVRMWAHSITPGWEMQKGPDSYDEKVRAGARCAARPAPADFLPAGTSQVLKGMDFVMDECHKRGLKIIWVLADNWYPTGGIDSFVKMGGASKHQDFFTSAAVKALYKKHISFMASRVNSINGRKYSEDPTIMAWCALLCFVWCRGLGVA